jgi:hypothetical protein
MSWYCLFHPSEELSGRAVEPRQFPNESPSDRLVRLISINTRLTKSGSASERFPALTLTGRSPVEPAGDECRDGRGK